MKKNILAGVLTFCLMMSLCSPALAVDGVKPTRYQDSNEAAEVNSEDGTTFTTTNDDDNLTANDDTAGTDIIVWASVWHGSWTNVYKLDIAWGPMTFTYSGGKGAWNPEDHTYAADTDPGWDIDNDVDGANNKITIRNHSAYQMYADLAFALEGAPFNDVPDGANNVVGYFFTENAAAVTAAGVLANTSSVASRVSQCTLPAPTQKAGSTPGSPGVEDVFFAFSGTPDPYKVQNTFSKVGTITVTFSSPHG